MKKEDNPELYQKALDWYTKTEPGYKKAALDLFSEEELRAGVEEYKKQKKQKSAKERQEFLQKMLERCKKMFHVGMLIWSEEYSDKCANIIISEPYIGKGNPRYISFDFDLEDKETTVLVDTLRISYLSNELITPVRKNKVCLESCIHMMDKDKNDQFYKNHIIDLIEYRKEKEKEKSERVSKLKKNIEALENELVRTKEELADLMSYNPAELSEEKIKQLIKEFENGKDGNR